MKRWAAAMAVSVAGIGAFAQEMPAPTNSAALPTNSTVITSETLTFDYHELTAFFEGNVVVTDPEVTIEAATMMVYFDDANNVKSIVASGNVRITQLDRKGYCKRAVYAAQTGAIVMTGDAVLRRALDSVAGDEIQIYVHAEKIVVRPGKLIVFPGTPEAGGTGLNRLRLQNE